MPEQATAQISAIGLRRSKVTKSQVITIGSLFTLIFCGSLAALIYGVVHKRPDTSVKPEYPTLPPSLPTRPPEPTPSTTTEDPANWQVDQSIIRRLANIRPLHYDVMLTVPSDGGLGFKGQVTIYFEMTKAQPEHRIEIYMENLDIEFDNSKLTQFDDSGNEISKTNVLGIQKPGPSGIVVLHLDSGLTLSNYSLRITYTGSINNETTGIFYKNYTENGSPKIMYATQSECCGGRRIFPCFDEPNLKATFSLEVTAPVNFTVISNMPQYSTRSIGNGMNTTRFEKTPKMSTYLLAFAITEFEYRETTAQDGTMIRTFARPEIIENGLVDLVINVSAKILDWYGEYFGMNYSSLMPKLDQIIVPPDLVPMENWGMITYGEQVSLFDVHKDPPSVAEYVILTVSHEMAHMWFGDLVTMSWWDQVWLNEGVADYLDYYANEAVASMNGSAEALLLTKAAENVLRNGQGKAVVKEINNTKSEIMSHLEIPIQYDKPAVAVLAKLSAAVGTQNLKEGFRRILRDFGYSNFNQDHLFYAIPTNITTVGELVYPELTNLDTGTIAGLPLGKSSLILLHRESQPVDPEGISNFYIKLSALVGPTPPAPQTAKEVFLNLTAPSPTQQNERIFFHPPGPVQSFYSDSNDALHGLYVLLPSQPKNGDVFAASVKNGVLKPSCNVAAKNLRDMAYNNHKMVSNISFVLDLAVFSMKQCYSTLFYALQTLDLDFEAPNGLQLLSSSNEYYAKYKEAIDSAAVSYEFPSMSFNPTEDNMLYAMARELLIQRALMLRPTNMSRTAFSHFGDILHHYKTNATVTIEPMLKKLSLCEGFRAMDSQAFADAKPLLCYYQSDPAFLYAFGCVEDHSVISEVASTIWDSPGTIPCEIGVAARVTITKSLMDQSLGNSGTLLGYAKTNFEKSTLSNDAKEAILAAAIANVYKSEDRTTVEQLVKLYSIDLDTTVIESNQNFIASQVVKDAIAWAKK